MKARILLSFLALVLCSAASAAAGTARQLTLNLTPDGAAQMIVFLPEQPSGRAVVCCPGGGYGMLSSDHEGTAWAGFFNERGIALAVVNYRLPHGDRTLPFSDVENAMRTMRDSAAVWHLHPHDIGIMGFSAGGHLAATIATHTQYALRPDFQILVYPVITMGRGTHQGSRDNLLGEGREDPTLVALYSNERQVRGHITPPAFIVLSNDDGLVPPVANGIAYYTAMRNVGNDCSLHVYPSGGHGYGFRPFAFHDQMLSDLSSWLDNLKAPKADAVRVACIGDSITDGYGIDLRTANGYPAQMQRMLGDSYWVRNFGLSARTLMNSGDRPYMREDVWQEARDFEPEIVVIKLGTNDAKTANWAHKAEFARDFQQMIDALKALPSHPKIYLCTPIPAAKEIWTISDRVIVGEMIPLINRVAKRNKLPVIDLHAALTGHEDLYQDDGIHPTRQGARLIAEVVAGAIDPAARTQPQGPGPRAR